MGIAKITNFNVYAQSPIDSRYVFTNSTSRDALASAYRYEGLITYVEADQAVYCLVGGITNSDWVKIASASGSAREVKTENENSFTGIEVGENIFTNPKSDPDIVVQVKDSNGQVLNLFPYVDQSSPYNIIIYSGVEYANAKVVII